MLKLSILPMIAIAAIFFFNPFEKTASFPPIIESENLRFKIDTVLSDLEVPWAMAFLPNGDMLFTEREGQLRLLKKNGQLHPDPIENVPSVKARGQGGLLDLELHPDYENNGWIYISYSSPKKSSESGDGANTEFIRAKLQNHQLTDIQSIFKASPNYSKSQHYGGRIEFDRAGYLYLAIGDRGGRDQAQDLNTYRGKVLRLHDDGRIPKDNPFLNRSDAHPEIFTYGHRNPQGLDRHPTTGKIWEHEHGPRGGDELNIIEKGNNYGWPVITYGVNYSGTKITDETHRDGMEQPITYWKPSIAPCGMSFVTSDRYPGWKGNILVGSLSFRYLERVELKGNKVVHQEKLLENIGRIRAIEESPDGYIYVAIEARGMIIRLLPV